MSSKYNDSNLRNLIRSTDSIISTSFDTVTQIRRNFSDDGNSLTLNTLTSNSMNTTNLYIHDSNIDSRISDNIISIGTDTNTDSIDIGSTADGVDNTKIITIGLGTGSGELGSIIRIGSEHSQIYFNGEIHQNIVNPTLIVESNVIYINENANRPYANDCGLIVREVGESQEDAAYIKVNSKKTGWEFKLPTSFTPEDLLDPEKEIAYNYDNYISTLRMGPANSTIIISEGNQYINGVLNCNSGITVNTNKFTIDENGNTYIDGSLNIGGNITLSSLEINGAITMNNITTPVDTTNKFYLSDDLKFGDVVINNNEDTKSPSGIISTSLVPKYTLTFNDTSRLLTITPISGDFYYYIKGVKYHVTDPLTITIEDVCGYHLIYMDGETINCTSDTDLIDDILLGDYAALASVIYNNDQSKSLLVGYEGHCCMMEGKTRYYIYKNFSTNYYSGGILNSYTLNTDTNAAVTVSLTDLQYFSIDILIHIIDGDPDVNYEQVLQPKLQAPILYRLLASTPCEYFDNPDTEYNLIVKMSDDVSPVPQYNELVVSDYQLTNVPDGDYYYVAIFACNSIKYPIKVLVGQTIWTSESDALTNYGIVALNCTPSIPSSAILLYRVLFHYSSTYTNVSKSVMKGVIDFRGSKNTSGQIFNPTSHSILQHLDYTSSGHVGFGRLAYTTTTNPTVLDDGIDSSGTGREFRVGDKWVNTTDDLWWICVDNSTGAAIWESFTQRITSSTNNAITRFDGIAGKIKNSGVTIDNSNNIDTNGIITVDTINEHTTNTGVTIESTLLKDSAIIFNSVTAPSNTTNTLYFTDRLMYDQCVLTPCLDTNYPTGVVADGLTPKYTLAFNDPAGVLTITPITTFYYYNHGSRHLVDSPVTITLPLEGGYFLIYMDDTDTIQYTQDHDLIDEIILGKHTILAAVIYNDEQTKALAVGYKGHTCIMDSSTRYYIYQNFGAKYHSGGALDSYTIDTDNLDAVTVNMADLIYFAVDLTINVTNGIVGNNYQQVLLPKLQAPISYRLLHDDSCNDFDEPDTVNNLIVKMSTDATPIPQYNELVGIDYQLTNVPDTYYYYVAIYAYNDIKYPIKVFVGQTVWDNEIDAIAEYGTVYLSITSNPAWSSLLLYRILFKHDLLYTNITKSVIKHVTDFRGSTVSGESFNPASHSILSNLDYASSGHSGFGRLEYVTVSDPTVDNDNVDTATIGRTFRIGDKWINGITDIWWICMDNSTGAAVWKSHTERVLSSTEHGIPRFNGTAGKIQDSNITIDDSNNLTTSGYITGGNIISNGTLDVNGATTLDKVTIETNDGAFNVTGNNAILLQTTLNAANSISLYTNGGTDETILIHSNLGNTATSINLLSTVGGITLNAVSNVVISNGISIGTTLDVNGATTLDKVTIDTNDGTFNVTGNNAILLETTLNAANSISLYTNGGTDETILIHSNLGNTATSINLLSTVGGITLNAVSNVVISNGISIGTTLDVNGATTLDKVTIETNDGAFNVTGNNAILLETTLNAANSISLYTNGGTDETILIHSNLGNTATSINLLSTVGGITLNAASNVVISNGISIGTTLDVNGATTLDKVTIETNDGAFNVTGNNAILLETTLNAANSISLYTNSGTDETILIHSNLGNTATSINLLSTVGGITLNAASNVVVSNSVDIISNLYVNTINEHTTNSGITIDGVLVKDNSIVLTAIAGVNPASNYKIFMDSAGTGNRFTRLDSSGNRHTYLYKEIATTMGDIYVYNGTETVQLAAGTNGQHLISNNATTTGLEWASKDYGSMYYTQIGTTIANGSPPITYERLLLDITDPTTSGTLLNFTQNNNCRLTYTGTLTKTFNISTYIIFYPSNTDVVYFEYNINGSLNTESLTSINLLTTARVTTVLNLITTLATNQYVEVFIAGTSARNYVVQSFKTTITEL